MSKQTIYNHFGDNEALFRAVVRAVQSEVAEDFHLSGLEERLAASDDLGRDLRQLGRRWVAVVPREDVAALRYLVQCGSWPAIGLPMRATGTKKHIWPITTVSVQSASSL